MREFASEFYHSQAWRKTRKAYAVSVGGLCERCLERGLIVPGEIVHHRTPLTPDNITDESVTLDWSNLKLVCRLCHAAEHEELDRDAKHMHRYTIDEYGRVSASEKPA